MKFDYSLITNDINKFLLIYQDGEFIYFLDPDLKGNLVLQEKENCLIIWSNEIKSISLEQLYSLFLNKLQTSILLPYIETEEELDAVKKLNGIKIELKDYFPEDDKLCNDYSRKYGSFIIKNK